MRMFSAVLIIQTILVCFLTVGNPSTKGYPALHIIIMMHDCLAQKMIIAIHGPHLEYNLCIDRIDYDL